MGRELFRTPDEDVTAEFDRVCQLFQLALGKPSDRVLFDSLMGEASEHGLNWVQGLEYVIEQRRAGDLPGAGPAQPGGPGAAGKSPRPVSGQALYGLLRKAG